ncbi:hypothetical protein TrCOL_g12865 [Triparma columacea]|uniref:CUE domain-containing protein n=1 Tax=Triparma columacea TaxID=722753 RepID=A0A9W7FWF8_9STRA|nr:hypothetical protein TrCOL_g12865 [Triparma columacea]
MRIESSGFDSAGILWLVENGFTNVSDDALSSSLGSEKVARGVEGLFNGVGRGGDAEMVYNSLLALTTSHSDSISAASQTDPHLKTRLLEVVRKRLKGWEVELTEYAIDAVRRACDGEAAARGIEESKGHDERALKTPEPTPPPKSLPELRIAKVKSVLPDLGEGYIELAIACYGGVEGAVEALMEFDQKDLHPRLRGVDRALPRRKIRDKGAYDAGMIDEKSKEAAKVRLAELAKEEEVKARVMEMAEYDDDYDDQYDHIDGFGVGDSGGMTQEEVREFNRVRRAEESEDSFWSEMKNDNKKIGGGGGKGGGSGEGDGEGDEEGSRFGKDKGKGGRVIGENGRYEKRMPGGKKKKKMLEKAEKTEKAEKQKGGDGVGLSEREKRQKGKNKAARGNHHRKDRATRKAGGGISG